MACLLKVASQPSNSCKLSNSSFKRIQLVLNQTSFRNSLLFEFESCLYLGSHKNLRSPRRCQWKFDLNAFVACVLCLEFRYQKNEPFHNPQTKPMKKKKTFPIHMDYYNGGIYSYPYSYLAN